MNFLERLNAHNNIKIKKPTVKNEIIKPVENLESIKEPEVQKSNVTFVMTACGRPDLMQKTLDSFFKFNTYKIDRFIVTEDSADPKVFEICRRLNRTKYNNKLEFVFNETKLGQARSIDLAYSMVDTDYVFHCEEDWEFYDDEFIEQSLSILEADERVLQAWIRPKTDKILNRIDTNIYSIDGIMVRDVLPISFSVSGAGPRGGNLIVKDYMGFSWNPGLKRMSDYRLLRKGYSQFTEEHMIDNFYKSHPKGFKVVSISESDDQGFVRHIGWGRRADNPLAGSEDRKDLETAKMEAQKKKEEEMQKAIEEVKKEKEESINKIPFVSIVMQSYLGDYPGARSNPVSKFHRAVSTFLNQPYSKSELIIVSDGCDITHQEYQKTYANNPRIKYAYVSKDGANMYEEVNGKKQYRGVPRRIGVSLASGDVISYMDSDDIILPTFVTKIAAVYVKYPEAKWFINKEWYDHINVFHPAWIEANGVGNSIIPHDKADILNLEKSLGVSIVKTKMKDEYLVSTPWLVAHHADCEVKWENTEYPLSEDVAFSRALREKYPAGITYREATYLRCHYKGAWDF